MSPKEALVENIKQYWYVWGCVFYLATWAVNVNQTVKGQAEIHQELKLQHAVQDEVNVHVERIETYMRDSLTSDEDLSFLWRQSQHTHKLMQDEINALRGRPQNAKEMPEFYPGYGTMRGKYKTWFEWYNEKGNQ